MQRSLSVHNRCTCLLLLLLLLQVKLPGNPRSSFWRFHTAETTDEGVCTIEALHLLVKALAGMRVWGQAQQG